MSRTRHAMTALARGVACVVVSILLCACGNGKKSPTGPSGEVASLSAEEIQYLIDHNARYNGDRTIRWGSLPVRVFTNDLAEEGEVTEWTRVTEGSVTFAFVGSARDANVTFGITNRPGLCAVSAIEWNADGTLRSVDVRVVLEVYRGPACERTVTHEVGHAIGFIDHTADGGLMDTDGGNGRFTPPVVQMVRNLYSLPPGTFLSVARVATAVQRGRPGRITLVYPVRR